MRTPAKMGLLGSLYFSQGLPFGFFTQALPVLLRQRGFSLGEIGRSSLLAVPWALKFLWAPAVDRYSSPGPEDGSRGSGTASALAGFSAQALGHLGHFCLATLLALGAVAAVRRCFPSPEAALRIRGPAAEVVPCA